MAVIEAMAARLDALDRCEHLAAGETERYWVALDPGRLLCGFCWETAQVLADATELACGYCGQPVTGTAGTDAVVVAKLAPDLAAHFWLCHACATADLDRGLQ